MKQKCGHGLEGKDRGRNSFQGRREQDEGSGHERSRQGLESRPGGPVHSVRELLALNTGGDKIDHFLRMTSLDNVFQKHQLA